MNADTALAAAIAFIDREEGCRLRPYQDSVGIWTIGIGNTAINGQRVTASTHPITQAQADALLAETVAPLLAKIRGWVGRPLSDAQWASLTSFAYNLGANTLFHSSLLTAVKGGYFDMAAGMFAPYCHAGGRVLAGLVARRAREAAAFGKRIEAVRKESLQTAAPSAPSATDALNDASLARAKAGG